MQKHSNVIGPLLKETTRGITEPEKWCNTVVQVLKDFQSSSGNTKLGYVSGIMTSDGRKFEPVNCLLLDEYAKVIGPKVTYPLFSPPDMITDEMRFILLNKEQKYVYTLYGRVFREVPVTDMFMTPRWQASGGANAEHIIAKEANIAIHYLDKDLDLVNILRKHRPDLQLEPAK